MDTVDAMPWADEAMAHAKAAEITPSSGYAERNATTADRIIINGLPLAFSVGYDVVNDVVLALRAGDEWRPTMDGRTNEIKVGQHVDLSYTYKGEAAPIGMYFVEDIQPYPFDGTTHELIAMRRLSSQ